MRTMPASQRSRWHLQAGIAAEHATAADYASTDWPTIVQYHDTLVALDSSAAPRLGQAIALAEAGEPQRALALLQALQPELPAALLAHLLAAQARAHERLGICPKRSACCCKPWRRRRMRPMHGRWRSGLQRRSRRSETGV